MRKAIRIGAGEVRSLPDGVNQSFAGNSCKRLVIEVKNDKFKRRILQTPANVLNAETGNMKITQKKGVFASFRWMESM